MQAKIIAQELQKELYSKEVQCYSTEIVKGELSITTESQVLSEKENKKRRTLNEIPQLIVRFFIYWTAITSTTVIFIILVYNIYFGRVWLDAGLFGELYFEFYMVLFILLILPICLVIDIYYELSKLKNPNGGNKN